RARRRTRPPRRRRRRGASVASAAAAGLAGPAVGALARASLVLEEAALPGRAIFGHRGPGEVLPLVWADDRAARGRDTKSRQGGDAEAEHVSILSPHHVAPRRPLLANRPLFDDPGP